MIAMLLLTVRRRDVVDADGLSRAQPCLLYRIIPHLSRVLLLASDTDIEQIIMHIVHLHVSAIIVFLLK